MARTGAIVAIAIAVTAVGAAAVGRTTSGWFRDEADRLTDAFQIVSNLRKSNKVSEVCVAEDASQGRAPIKAMFASNQKIRDALEKETCDQSVVSSCCLLYREGTALVVVRAGDNLSCGAPPNAQPRLRRGEIACRPISQLGELLDLIK